MANLSRLPEIRISGVESFVASGARKAARDALARLSARRCPGAELLGWLDLPERIRASELPAIRSAAAELRERFPVLVVVGIGGSSLGARAALAALGRAAGERAIPAEPPCVVFAGHHLDGVTLRETLASLAGVDYAVNVISKSGTTTEPGIAFRILLDDLRRRHGEAGWRRRVVATTDPERGALRELARENALTTFAIPRDVGGRFSVLSPVGLLPLAFAGIDIEAILDGASAMAELTLADDPDANPAIGLAAARWALYEAGYGVEVLSYTDPHLRGLAAWWQQLAGESEGKGRKGAFPASCEIPADLHSLGQYLQEGRRQVYEIVLHVRPAAPLRVPPGDDRDGLAYLEGRGLDEVIEAAVRGTIDAHRHGGVPVIEAVLPSREPFVVGAAFFLFQVTIAVTALLHGVNPFDQPGVEAYKMNMFRRLGRPGYEQ